MIRFLRAGLAIAAAVALISNSAAAQRQAQTGPNQVVSYDLSLQDADDEPESDEPECDLLESDDCGCQSTCGGCGKDPGGLPLGIDLRGWISGGVTFNDDSPPSRFNGVTTFNDRCDELQLNQLYLVAERPLETGGCGWAVGGRVDLLFGTDSRFVEVDGLAADWNSYPAYGLAIPQMYLEAGYGDLSVKVGHFYTMAGYETPMAPDNFFYSHAYTMQYGEPFTHTGVLAGWAVTDTITLMSGFDRGWDRFNPNPDGDHLNYIGGVSWDNGNGTSIALSVTSGIETANPFIPFLQANRYMYSLVLQQEIGRRWTYVFQHDCGNQESGSPFTGLTAEWYGINQYLFYQINPCWTAGLRVEWFRDDDGLMVGGIGDRNTGSSIVPFGFAGDFCNVSVGANYQPNDRLTVRPELRFDYYDGFSGFGPRPFNDGGDDSQVTFGIDFIYTF